MNKKILSFTFSLLAISLLAGCNFKSSDTDTTETPTKVTTPLQDKASVKKIFMEKYDTPVNEMKIEDVEQDTTHMRGKISLAKEGGESSTKLFLAVREGDQWKVVFEGEGTQIPCSELEKNNFPENLSENCAE